MNDTYGKLWNIRYRSIGTVSILLAILSVVFLIGTVQSSNRLRTLDVAERNAEQIGELADATQQLAELVNNVVEGNGVLLDEITLLRLRLDLLESASSNSDSPTQPPLPELKAQLDSITSRLDAIETGIGESPARALSVPLLQSEVQNLRSQVDAVERNSDADVTRIYDQNKWFIGLMATVVLTIVTLAIGNFVRKGK